jgi:hypothetical protein
MNQNQQQWESYIEVPDWRRKRWRFNYSKHVSPDGWVLDWEVLSPDGSTKASGEKDSSLAHRCLNKSGMIDKLLLEHEFIWWVNHYTNSVNIKLLKAIQSEVQA